MTADAVIRAQDYTARREHRCWCCRRPIAVGERYARRVGIHEGGFYSVAERLDCRAARLATVGIKVD